MFHSRSLCRLSSAAFISLLAFPGWAQPALTLPEAQRIALSRSQQLVAQDAAAKGLRELQAAAGRLPDPVLKLGIDNLPLNGPDRLSLTRDFMTMRRIGVMQELPRAEKRQLKVERLQRDSQRVLAERELAVATVRRETALAWIERHYALAQLELLRQQAQETRLQIQGAEIAFKSGRGSQADFFGARAALAMLQDKQLQTERQVQRAALMLARWIGPDAAAQPASGPIPWQESAQAQHLSADHLQRLPQLGVLAAQVQAAETEVRQAEANTRADWTVEATYSQRGPAYSNMVSVGVSIPLQLDRANRQDRETAAKVAALSESRATFEEALRTHEAELRVLLNDWSAGKDRVAMLTAHLLPAARQRTEAALTTYRSGKSELGAVLTARRDEVDARLQLLALEMETARLWAQLNYLTADADPPVNAKELP